MLGKNWCIFFLSILKTNLFFDLLSKCNFTLDLAFCAFLNISKTARQESETKGPHNIHSLRSSCFINSIQRRRKPCYEREIHVPKRIWQLSPKSKTRHARGREESLELYSILWSDWPTTKQRLLSRGYRFAARVRRRYFWEGEKRLG